VLNALARFLLISPFPSRSVWLTALLCLAVVPAASPLAHAQQAADAALEIRVRAAPTAGRAENVMRHPFYLLRASIEEIEEAARQQELSPDFDAFVDELKVTPELKEWMKKNQTMTLKGDDFLTSLTPDDVLDIPEFRAAYIARNLIMVGLGFPKRKAKLTDREKNPEKWEQSEKRYEEELRSYAILHPESFKNMDDHLLDLTADVEWRSLEERYEQKVKQTFMRLLHSRYLVAQTETDYAGRARFAALPAGRYWLTNLNRPVRAGDVHLRWEVLVELQSGRSHFLELNNANAIYLSQP
jgi:hypothetical protein